MAYEDMNNDETADALNEIADALNDTQTEEVDVSAFDLNIHVHRLLMDEPFFAALSRRMDKRATNAIPTAGVTVTEEGKLQMVYNPKFFAPLSDDARKDILKHEFYHIVFQHVTGGRFLSFRDMAPNERKIHNIAMDLAINGHLPNLPEGACFPGKGPFAHLEPFKSAEHYLRELRKMQKDEPEGEGKGEGEGGEGGTPGGQGGGQGQGNPLDGMDSFDDHSGWDEMDDQTKQIAEERVKEFIKDAVEEANTSSRGWGSVPSDCRKDIIASISTKVDWRKVLRYFVKQSQKANKRSTVRKINKRYPYMHPGKKATRTAKIAIAIDQSGSVSEEMLTAFFSELNTLAKIAEFTVVPFDTRVDPEKNFVWKKGQSRKTERTMYGGTCFDAPTKFVNETGGFDGLIICTDMEAPKPVRCNVQRMWITDTRSGQRPYFNPKPERMVVIPTDK
jgi:predicted metal-dependent peptidase